MQPILTVTVSVKKIKGAARQRNVVTVGVNRPLQTHWSNRNVLTRCQVYYTRHLLLIGIFNAMTTSFIKDTVLRNTLYYENGRLMLNLVMLHNVTDEQLIIPLVHLRICLLVTDRIHSTCYEMIFFLLLNEYCVFSTRDFTWNLIENWMFLIRLKSKQA